MSDDPGVPLAVAVMALVFCGSGWLFAADPCAEPTHKDHVTRADRKAVLARAGISWSNRSHYVVRYVVPLDLGGSNDLANLEPQTTGDARRKQRVEDALRACLCNGAMPLDEAQLAVRRWHEVDLAHPCYPVRPKRPQ